MIGLSLGMLLACLDGTIVATSLPAILQDLHGYELYSWVFTGYMLCETIMIPIAGKLSDQYGRKPIFITGLLLFMSGSILSGMSNNMTELIMFRAIQGLGGGILIPVATATVADLYAPQDRGKIQGMLGALFAVATCLGPFLGGYITDTVGWHWVFYINLPFGIASLIFTMKKFPKQERVDNVHVDYIGMALLSLFLIDLLLFFTWVGVDFAWVSTDWGLMIVIAVFLLALFIFNEFKAKDPVLKPALFKGNVFVWCCIIMMIFGMGMMGAMTYLPMFMQKVVGMSATNSGVILLPLIGGMMITSIISGFTVKRTGYRPWLIVGPIVTAFGMGLMSTLTMTSGVPIAIFYLFITGIGMGCVMSVVMIAAQNSAKKEEMGMTTSSVNLFRSIGSTVAVGIFTTIINGKIATELMPPTLPQEIYDILPHSTDILNYLTSFPDYATAILGAYGESVTYSFLIAGILTLFAVVGAVMMKVNKISDSDEENSIEIAEKFNSNE